MDNQSKFERIAEQVESWREELGVPGAAFGLRLADIQFRGGLPSDRELEAMRPAEIALCGPDQLLVLTGYFEGTRADFLRDEAGEIRYLRFGSRLNPRLD